MTPLPRQEADATLARALQAHLERQCGAGVELIETHVSWVLLAGRHAYKLKKRVHWQFIDFRALADRRHACEEEVRLNKRFAPTLYLGVVPVSGSDEDPVLAGPGEPIDYVVKMKRFPTRTLLSVQLEQRRLRRAQIDRLAGWVAGDHGGAPRLCVEEPYSRPEEMLQSVLTVLTQLQALDPAQPTTDLRAWFELQARALVPHWRRRRESGCVRELHGDLHLENIVQWGDTLAAFDCIEFDPRLRWIDVMRDLAFLTMDLRARGRPDFAWRLLNAYLEATGDYDGLRVLRFHEAERAAVRALVARLKSKAAAPGSTSLRPDYLALARELCEPMDARLLITHGVSGSGKTAVSQALLECTGAIRLRSDVERKRLFGLSALQHSGRVALRDGLYGKEATDRTYEQLRCLARAALEAGWRVIIDAAFLRRDQRDAFRALADEMGLPFTILDCTAQPETLLERVRLRSAAAKDASDADERVLERQLASYEPLGADELRNALQVHTDAPVNVNTLGGRWLAVERVERLVCTD